MVQQVKALATKPDKLTLMPGVRWKERWLPQLVRPLILLSINVHAPAHAHRHINAKLIYKNI